jgi:hypothetical protein
VDRPSSPSQSYGSSHPCIEHEGENAKQTDHLQTLQTNHQNLDLLNRTETHHEYENQPPACLDLNRSARCDAPV